MSGNAILLWSAVSILWVCMGIKANIHMNSVDNDAIAWKSLSLVLRIIFIITGPILFLIFERHMLAKRIH